MAIGILFAVVPARRAGAKPAADVASVLKACLDKGEAAVCEKACKLGSGRGCFEAGTVSYQAEKPAKKKAAGLFDKGCTLKEPLACANLGLMLVKGDGIPKDAQRGNKALAWACDKDDATACTELGNSYVAGRGVPRDLNKAIELHRRACKLGDQKACANLDAAGAGR